LTAEIQGNFQSDNLSTSQLGNKHGAISKIRSQEQFHGEFGNQRGETDAIFSILSACRFVTILIAPINDTQISNNRPQSESAAALIALGRFCDGDSDFIWTRFII
jgi:hypothetical protein